MSHSPEFDAQRFLTVAAGDYHATLVAAARARVDALPVAAPWPHLPLAARDLATAVSWLLDVSATGASDADLADAGCPVDVMAMMTAVAPRVRESHPRFLRRVVDAGPVAICVVTANEYVTLAHAFGATAAPLARAVTRWHATVGAFSPPATLTQQRDGVGLPVG